MSKRSRFEPIPEPYAGVWNTPRVARRIMRFARPYTGDQDVTMLSLAEQRRLPFDLKMEFIRSFGINQANRDDRRTFAIGTGRLQYLQRALREFIDRRRRQRRQVYMLLRRLLPLELTQKVMGLAGMT